MECVNYRVSFEKQTLNGLQRLFLPFSESRLFGKYAQVKLSNGAVYISRIFPCYFLTGDSCLMDDTVCSVYSKPEIGLKLIQLTLIQNISHIRTVNISIVFKGVKKNSNEFMDKIKNILGCFTLISGCFVSFNCDEFKFMGVERVLVHNIGNMNAGRVVDTSKIVVDKLISHERYKQSTAVYSTSIKGFEAPYKKLKDFLDCREALSKSNFAKRHQLSQVMLIGSSGSGKKSLVQKVSQDSNAYTLIIDCTELNRPKPGECESFIREKFNQAILLADEGLVIILFLHPESICKKPGRVLSQLLALVDSISETSNIIAVMSTCSTVSLHESVRTTSRFNYEVFIEIPNEINRNIILNDLCIRNSLPTDHCSQIAQLTSGYTISDLALLISKTSREISEKSECGRILNLFKKNIQLIEPSTLRGEIGVVKTNTNLEITPLGGLNWVKKELTKLVKWSLLHNDAFCRLNIQSHSGCLLYGPPGCAKTSLTRAVALESNLTFFSVSAADLYSPYVGDAERTISNLFQRARTSAPSILFIDEIDALVGNRGGNHKGSHERVLSTFLIEMDGVGKSKLSDTRVIVLAATNRPHVIDSALLRPGRFDKLLYVPPPSIEDRKDILKMLTQKMPIEKSIDLDRVAKDTDMFSGADLANLCREVALMAMTECGADCDLIKKDHFTKVLKELKPSLSENQILWYDNFSFAQSNVSL